ncbi:ATP-binding cassette sub-family C member 9-like [Saccoglossus kowalevskii]
MAFVKSYTNLLSRISIWWLNWLILLSHKQPLKIEDLGCLPEEFECNYVKNQFRKALLIERNTSYVTVDEFLNNGFVLVMIVFVFLILNLNTWLTAWGMTMHIGIKMKTAIQNLVYEQTLRASTQLEKQLLIGQALNHMSVDAVAVQWFFHYSSMIFAAPIQILFICILLVWKLGPVGCVGLGFVVIALPLQFKIAREQRIAQQQTIQSADTRLKKTTEFLQGIKFLKLCGWEELFASRILCTRDEEMKQTVKVGLYFAYSTIMSQSLPVIVPLFLFGTYSMLNTTPLTPDLLFSSLALTSLFVGPLFMMPMYIKYLVEAISSIRRLDKFLYLDNTMTNQSTIDEDFTEDYIDVKNKYQTPTDDCPLLMTTTVAYTTAYSNSNQQPQLQNLNCKDIHNNVIEILAGSFSWDRDSKAPVLHEIDVRISQGTLSIIVGKVGSGKSSLLSAILAEMNTLSGTISFERDRHRVSYAAQKPWLQNASLKDNILFGETYDPVRYQSVLDVCCLNVDLQVLPGGDMIEIGEQGVNLSGGQKQRISLARALYTKSDIVILDDSLSALDVHVGEHVMEKAILGFLLGSNRTVILVTHQLQYLKHADQVLVMENGKITHQGKLSHIRRYNKDLFEKWRSCIIDISGSGRKNDVDIETKENISNDIKRLKHFCNDNAALIEEEERQSGPVRKVFYSYAKALKLPHVMLIFILFFLEITANISINMWLSSWSQESQTNIYSSEVVQHNLLRYYFSRYAIIVLIFVLLAILTCHYQVMFSIAAAKRLFIKLLHGITHAPNRFFDITPIGRILNRFSHDTMVVDLNTIGATFVLFTGFGALLAGVYFNMRPSDVGLAIATALSASTCISALLVNIVDFVYYINGVERLIEYSRVQTELYEGTIVPPDHWPNEGSISLKNISVRYAEGLAPVLQNMTLQIKAKQKVGICGRTGSGKSSLTLAILRMIDVYQGQVIIDGIDVSRVPVLTLRNSISIIPQDPVMFSGTIRFNLDPERRYSCQDLWHALEIAQLKDCITVQDGGLDAYVTEGGHNFSTGQRQLFSLARAFLHKSQIVILDEATASIDVHTEAILQNVLATAFAEKTVITIAHRISTIFDCDIVLVLSEGKLVEYDSPQKLLSNKNSVFASLVNGRS